MATIKPGEHSLNNSSKDRMHMVHLEQVNASFRLAEDLPMAVS